MEDAPAAGLALQKKLSRAAEQERPDVAQKRADWRDCQQQVDPQRLVFLDETGVKTDLSRLRGWAESGARLVEAIPGGHWGTSTLVHAISLDGTRAAMVLDGPLNSVCFRGFCEQFLAPTLRPGDMVVLDNLPSHKSSSAAAAVESVGAKLVYLPPYSPDLNPIENIFSKLKQSIRGLRPRTWRQIIQATQQALLNLTHNDLENAFNHCGYETT